MRLIHDGKIFISESTYYEKDIPKSAKFRWNPDRKIWWTDDPLKADRLREYATEDTLKILDKLVAEKNGVLESSRAKDADIDIPSPDGWNYMPFQKAGIAYALDHPNCLIADEMGLGKTIQAIGLMNLTEVKSALVICPKTVMNVWEDEFSRWLTLPISVARATSKEFPSDDVVIINYDIVKKHSDAIRSREWDIMVCDESHYLKNHKAQRTKYTLGCWNKDPEKAIPKINAKRVLFLTGTPIINRPVELWPILHFALPNTMGRNWRGFVRRYCGGHQTEWGWDVTGATNLGELQERLRMEIMVRRLKKDVLTELPLKLRQVIELPANGCVSVIRDEQKAMERLEKTLAELRVRVELAKASESREDYEDAVIALREGVTAAFNEIASLRHRTAVAKIPVVVEFLMDVLENKDKVVIFAHHHDVVDGISLALEENDIDNIVLTGKTPHKARKEIVKNFQEDPDIRVFIGNIQAAGVGITLTASSHVIFAELDWVPGNMTQAEDRCHRIGQNDNVLVQHLVLEESLDIRMAHALIDKQAVIDAALDKKHEENFVLPIVEPTTKNKKREQIAREAEELSEREIELVHSGLSSIASVCDGAQALDGMGFNKLDTDIGKSLASQDRLTPRQAALGKHLCRKYKRQIPEIWEKLEKGE